MFLKRLALNLGAGGNKGAKRDDGTGRRRRLSHSRADRATRRRSLRSNSEVTMTMDGMSEDAFFDWDDQEATAHLGQIGNDAGLGQRTAHAGRSGAADKSGGSRGRDGKKRRSVQPGFDAAKPGASKEGVNEVLPGLGPALEKTPAPRSAVPKLLLDVPGIPASIGTEQVSMQPFVDGEPGKPIGGGDTPTRKTRDDIEAPEPKPVPLDALALKRAGKMHKQAVIDTWVACQACLTERERKTNARLRRERKRQIVSSERRPTGSSDNSSRFGDSASDDVPTLLSAATGTATATTLSGYGGNDHRRTVRSGSSTGGGDVATPQARSRSGSRSRPKLGALGRRQSSFLGVRYEEVKVVKDGDSTRPESRMSLGGGATHTTADIEQEEEREFQLLEIAYRHALQIAAPTVLKKRASTTLTPAPAPVPRTMQVKIKGAAAIHTGPSIDLR